MPLLVQAIVPPHGVGLFKLCKDSSSGDYELLVAGERGMAFVFSDSRHPLVLRADGPWQPAPVEATSHPRIYFRVPEHTENARIHFAGSARLQAPDGTPWNRGEPIDGWVDLPYPGLWSFTPVDNQPVTVENIPPFFAFRDPAYHFIPDLGP